MNPTLWWVIQISCQVMCLANLFVAMERGRGITTQILCALVPASFMTYALLRLVP